MTSSSFDVIVVGAGIAGSACARFLSEGGRRVALVERRPFDRAGARWVNGVPRAAFDDARIARPRAPELRSEGHPFVVASPSGRTHVRLEGHPVLEVDMRHLGARMRDGARDAGSTLLGSTAVEGVELDPRTRRPLAISTREGTLRAPLFIDASGLPAVVRRAVFPRWPSIAREHVCLAAQSVHRIDDLDGARRFLERWRAAEAEVHARCGTHGGYSVLNVRVDLGDREVSVLAGAISGVADGASMIAELRRDEPWIGETIFGGAGALPLTRPLARLVAPGLALLGDAASQMFSAHGSGIAIGLRAARLLADVVLEGAPSDAGDEALLWRYAARFQRTHGGLLAAYDRVRRASQSLTRDEVERLFDAGLVGDTSARAAMLQELPRFSFGDVTTLVRRSLRDPRLVARTAVAFGATPLFLAQAARYPNAPDLDALARWEARMASLMREDARPVD